jgi:predicted acylesterase/phospholipase RssA
LSRFGRHFVRTRDIKEFERKLIRLMVERPGALNEQHEALYRWAAVLAKLHTLRTPEGHDVSIEQDVDNLRQWMLETITPSLPKADQAQVELLRELAPILAVRLENTRKKLLERHINSFGPEHLDDEIRHKKLVLVLGGGGGAGLFHLGVFSLFNELGIVPELIVGSSMGSLMGTIRALDRDYDPVATGLALPRDIDYNAVFRPFTGFSRFGFPGAFHMNLLRISREVLHKLVGKTSLRFDELPIKLHIVATGVRTGFQLDERTIQPGDASGLSALAMTRRLRSFFSIVRQISQNPRFLTQVAFGKEPGTEHFPIVEAVGFSCSVPGLLHYDVYHDDPETIAPLEQIFERHQLWRMCDGGVVNNVASQVAWDSVQHGELGSRNAYIFASDVFAPISSGRNLIWVPIQQYARQNVLANKPYADFHKTFRDPPSPIQLVVDNYSKIKGIVVASRAELADDLPYIRRALTPLPPYGTWSF